LWLCACDGLVCRVCASQAGSSFTTRWHEMRTPMLEPSPARSCVGSCRIDRARSGVGFFDRDLAGGDFAQRRDYFFIVRFHQWPRALEQLFGAPGRAEHELEAVGNIFQAIFNGNSCHLASILRCIAPLVNAPAIGRLERHGGSASLMGRFGALRHFILMAGLALIVAAARPAAAGDPATILAGNHPDEAA